MKAKKLLILTLAFSMLGIGSIVAGSPWGDFKGYPKAKVNVNGSELASDDVPAFVVNGETVVPLRGMADSLQSLVAWDAENNVSQVYKPNVHMLITEKNVPFGKVPKGYNESFVVSVQVDELLTSIHSYKIQIEDPNGVVLASKEEIAEQMESFWYSWKFKVNFNEFGKYRVKFLMKLTENSDYAVVSDKVIYTYAK
jgi:hypothetical protein